MEPAQGSQGPVCLRSRCLSRETDFHAAAKGRKVRTLRDRTGLNGDLPIGQILATLVSEFSTARSRFVAKKRLVECRFFIPIHRDKNLSHGLPHLTDAWEWLDDRLYEFEGATRSGALQFGFYVDRDTKERVEDQSCRYEVALPRVQVAKLRSLLRDACRVFQQKSIYLSVAGYVEFVEGMENEVS
jgi:hypothetical protein